MSRTFTFARFLDYQDCLKELLVGGYSCSWRGKEITVYGTAAELKIVAGTVQGYCGAMLRVQ